MKQSASEQSFIKQKQYYPSPFSKQTVELFEH